MSDQEKVFAQILESHVSNAEELMSAILDIQAHDNLKFDECVASMLMLGVVARKRSIEYSQKTKLAKQTASNLARYNAAIAAHPEAALNPKANATLMLAYSLITREQYDAILKSLDGAQASVVTHEVAVNAK